MLEQFFSPSVQHVLDLIGIFVFAISGALLAVRKNFDVFGIAVLAEVTALAVVTAFVLRLLAMRYHWRAPRAWKRRSTAVEVE